MSIQEYILAGSKLPIHNHYQLRLTRLESQQAGITDSGDVPASRLLALLQPLVRTTRTSEGIASVIRTQASNTQVTVKPHKITRMPAGKRAKLSFSDKQRLAASSGKMYLFSCVCTWAAITTSA